MAANFCVKNANVSKMFLGSSNKCLSLIPKKDLPVRHLEILRRYLIIKTRNNEGH